METVMLEFNSAGRQVFLAFNIANRVQDTRSAGRRKWHKADGSKSIFLTGRGELSAAEYVDFVVVQTKDKSTCTYTSLVELHNNLLNWQSAPSIILQPWWTNTIRFASLSQMKNLRQWKQSLEWKSRLLRTKVR
jgi:hypothetical protein